MSGLWTPGGEVPSTPIVGEPAPEAGGPGGPQPTPEEVAAMRQLLRQLAAVPMADHVVRHVEGLLELAALHLNGFEDVPPNLTEAAVAIDAIAGIVDALGDRLGANAQALRDLVAQLRLAWVEVQQQVGGPGPTG